MPPPIKFKISGPAIARLAGAESELHGTGLKPLEPIAAPSLVNGELSALGPAVMKDAVASGEVGAASFETVRAMARRQLDNNVMGEVPGAIPLDVTAPGNLKPMAPSKLPKIEWPKTADEAIDALQAKGYEVAERPSGSTLLRKGEREVLVTPMTVAETHGYVADANGARYIRLGDNVFTKKEWKAFQKGYEEPRRIYNRALNRPKLLERAPVPKDGSPLHAPHDGVKEYLSRAELKLAKSVAKVAEMRELKRELSDAEDLVRKALKRAKNEGRLPKHFAEAVEGVDGASKTGNLLIMGRLLEEVGYDVKFKPFRRPSAEEAALAETSPWGEVARYASFVDPANTAGPTAWLLDRAWPGDKVHNSATNGKKLSKLTNRFEQMLRENGVEVVKWYFDPTPLASMKTFGKRISRRDIAAAELRRRGDSLDPETRASLEAAASMTAGINDIASVPTASATKKRYREFTKSDGEHSEWNHIETADRHGGHVKTLKRFAKIVDDLPVIEKKKKKK